VDHWDWNALLAARKSDPIQQWADMESKSPTMREEIYRDKLPAAPSRTNALALFVVSAKLLATTLSWISRSR
jgi:hypothetical protein